MKKVIILLFFVFILTGCSQESNLNVNEKYNNDTIVNKENINEEVVLDVESKDEDSVNSDTDSSGFNKESNEKDLDINSITKNENIEKNNVSDKIDNELVDTSYIKTEDDVVNYFVKLKGKVVEKVNSDTWDNVKESVINGLNTAYGFCFKGEEIGGYTLSELSSDAKEKILKIVFDIDSFIESKSPGYKELFKESYDNMIESTKASLGLIKDKISNFFSNNNE